MALVILGEWKFQKTIKPMLLGFIFFGFLFTAFYQAWQDESLKRLAAENDGNFYKQESAYNRKRSDRLSDALAIKNATAKSQVVNDSSVHQSSGTNNGTVIQAASGAYVVNSGPNLQGSTFSGNGIGVYHATITPDFINRYLNLPAAIQLKRLNIIETNILSINEPVSRNGIYTLYRTVFLLKIENLGKDEDMNFGDELSPNVILATEPIVNTKVAPSSIVGTNNYGYAAITFLTRSNVQASDFRFFVESKR